MRIIRQKRKKGLACFILHLEIYRYEVLFYLFSTSVRTFMVFQDLRNNCVENYIIFIEFRSYKQHNFHHLFYKKSIILAKMIFNPYEYKL